MFRSSANIAPRCSPFAAAVNRALTATAASKWCAVQRIARSLSADNDVARATLRRRPGAAVERGGCGIGSLGCPASTCFTKRALAGVDAPVDAKHAGMKVHLQQEV